MGLRGPPPTPGAILEMRGSSLVSSRGKEPEPERALPRVPAWMPKLGRPLFRELCRQLSAMGILGTCDRNVLARYVLLFLRWRRAEEFLEKHGDTWVVRGKGKKQPDGTRTEGPVLGWRTYPQVRISRQTAAEMLRIEDRIGLSPTARARLAGYVQGDGGGAEAVPDRFFGTG